MALVKLARVGVVASSIDFAGSVCGAVFGRGVAGDGVMAVSLLTSARGELTGRNVAAISITVGNPATQLQKVQRQRSLLRQSRRSGREYDAREQQAGGLVEARQDRRLRKPG